MNLLLKEFENTINYSNIYYTDLNLFKYNDTVLTFNIIELTCIIIQKNLKLKKGALYNIYGTNIIESQSNGKYKILIEKKLSR